MNYQNYFQNIETELPRRIIVANGLSDLPAERQEKISEIVAEMMITRSIHALLAHLTDTKFEEISDELESDDDLNESDILRMLAERTPHSQVIIHSEMENIFSSLSPTQ